MNENGYGERFVFAIAEELRAQKARKGLSDNEISKGIGIHRVSVSRYLNGERAIPLVVFADLCRLFEISPAEIMGNAEEHVYEEQQSVVF